MPMTIVEPSDDDFVGPEAVVQESAVLDGMTAAERKVELRYRHPGATDQLQLLEVRFAPGTGAEPHAHEVDEIFFVVEGEMRFGSRTCRAGTSIHIPRLTQYSFRAGPEGVRFLNFRACADDSLIRPAELRSRK